MRLTITEVFCEIVSALGCFVAIVLPILHWTCVLDISELMARIKSLESADLLGILVLAYICGVVLDSLGLPIDRILPQIGIAGQNPAKASKKNFYKEASSDLFAYRTNAWVHFYCFRNLFVFTAVGAVIWATVCFVEWGAMNAARVGVSMIVAAWLLYHATKTHANFYKEVTQTFD